MKFQDEFISPEKYSNFYDWVIYHGFSKHRFISKTPKKGFCGCVWLLKNKEHGGRIAIKTVDHPVIHRPWVDEHSNPLPVEVYASDESEFNSEALEHFVREVRIGLEIPSCVNVVRTVDVEEFICNRNGSPWWDEENDDDYEDAIKLPVIKMECWDGSLEDLIDNPKVETLDIYIFLAQAINGLIFLYEHGIEAHGDLKLGNLLYRKLPDKFPHENMWPNNKQNIVVGIGDFGWSNVWKYFQGPKYQRTAERRYLSPERINSPEQKIKSAVDVFSFGVIAAELLQGDLPYSKRSLKSDSNWIRCVLDKNISTDKIENRDYKNLIDRCLDFDPENRPLPMEVLEATCDAVHRLGGDNYAWVIKTMDLWRTEYSTDFLERAEQAIRKIKKYSTKEAILAIKNAIKIIPRTSSLSIREDSRRSTLILEAAKVCQCIRGEGGEIDDVSIEVRGIAESVVLARYKEMDLKELCKLDIDHGYVSPDETHFYSYSVTVSNTTDAVLALTGASPFQSEGEVCSSSVLSNDMMRSGYCFGKALANFLVDGKRMSEYCDWAINIDARMAEPYALRGRIQRQNIFSNIHQNTNTQNYELDDEKIHRYFTKWKTDLETACELKPDWPLSRDWLIETEQYYDMWRSSK